MPAEAALGTSDGATKLLGNSLGPQETEGGPERAVFGDVFQMQRVDAYVREPKVRGKKGEKCVLEGNKKAASPKREVKKICVWE